MILRGKFENLDKLKNKFAKDFINFWPPFYMHADRYWVTTRFCFHFQSSEDGWTLQSTSSFEAEEERGGLGDQSKREVGTGED